MCEILHYLLTMCRFTQKPRVIVSECSHARAVLNMDEVQTSSSRKGESSPEVDLGSVMCASPNAKVHGVLTATDKAQEEVPGS